MVLDWVEAEFAHIDFGDRRLNQRLKICISQAAGMGESTPDRAKSKADLKSTYRFVDNSKVSMEQIFAEHNRSTIERCRSESRVYVPQDTSEIDLTKPRQQVKGAGPLGTDNRRGLFLHPAYAVNEANIPLGLLDQIIWTRDPESLKKTSQERRAERRTASFEEKESSRWLEMLQSVEQIARSVPDTEFVMIADSEADICELFCEVPEKAENFHFIVRQRGQRAILSATDQATGKLLTASTVDEALSQAEVRFQRTVKIGGRDAPITPDDKKRARKQARTSREAVLEVRSVSVVIRGPLRPGGGRLADVQINVVEAVEVNPPEGEVPVRWVLFTTLPVESNDDCVDVLNGYCKRWSVELYFKTLKSGMKIEDLKYETLDRYLVAFAMLCVVAWRVEYLKGANRGDPQSPCTKYFTDEEWMAVMTFLRRGPVDPRHPPTTHEFMVAIACLGGYIDKKSQGPPGSQTIWRGMSRFETIVQAFAIFNRIRCGE